MNSRKLTNSKSAGVAGGSTSLLNRDIVQSKDTPHAPPVTTFPPRPSRGETVDRERGVEDARSGPHATFPPLWTTLWKTCRLRGTYVFKDRTAVARLPDIDPHPGVCLPLPRGRHSAKGLGCGPTVLAIEPPRGTQRKRETTATRRFGGRPRHEAQPGGGAQPAVRGRPATKLGTTKPPGLPGGGELSRAGSA